MTTLAEMRANIIKDIGRNDPTINDTIDRRIAQAIRKYKEKRFYFNEREDVTFDTIPEQVWYDATDNPLIPLWVRRDDIRIYENNGVSYEMAWYPIQKFNKLVHVQSARGRAYGWTWYNQRIGLYPVATTARTVRISGQFSIPGPASDTEENNVWMNEAYDLIASSAKRLFHQIDEGGDPQEKQAALDLENEAFSDISIHTDSKIGTGLVRKQVT